MPQLINYICIIAIVILVICVLILARIFWKTRTSYEALKKSFEEMEEMNTTLRAQRHDQMNHLQVVYGLLEMEAYDDIKTYLTPVWKEIQKTGKALKTSKPALNALLMAKASEAESRGIDMFVEVKSDLKELRMPDWELCKVLSNIIDNGMTALSAKESDRQLRVDISEDRETYLFIISNNGPEIPDKIREEIFRQGFTSKKEAGHGMGLSIVRKVLAGVGGTVTVSSDPDETMFTVTVAKKP